MIDIYVNEIRQALKHQCYFPALALALALPDICGMAEFPHLRVTERYIAWYDKYLGQAMVRDGGAPYLSGEVVYNLRNTFLHQGSPSVQSGKVREEVNQVDRFILLLGDGTEVHELSVTGRTGTESFKLILVDVTYLCTSICDAALWYYTRKRGKFQTDLDVIPQADFRAAGGFAGVAAHLTIRNYGGLSGNHPSNSGSASGDAPAHGGTALTPGNGTPASPPAPGKEEIENREAAVKPPESRAEHQLRCFFGEYFKEKKYRERRDDIISAALSAQTKAQLNSSLTKLFPGEDVKVILQRLEPQFPYLPNMNAETKPTPAGTADAAPKEKTPPPAQKSGKTEQKTGKNAKEAGKAAQRSGKNTQKAGKEEQKPAQKAVQKKTAKSAQTGTEHQIRCLFGQNFKEKKYREKRDDIVGAVLSAKSRQQLNNSLTKLFPGDDVKVILKRFREQIKGLPGQ